mmetsp:Transcript_23838/g.26089  ORF Transcript_23838/g.26089 Transcript_23838/m.26089 type:complete len:131 (+) Transcript_23838:109-501(+)
MTTIRQVDDEIERITMKFEEAERENEKELKLLWATSLVELQKQKTLLIQREGRMKKTTHKANSDSDFFTTLVDLSFQFLFSSPSSTTSSQCSSQKKRTEDYGPIASEFVSSPELSSHGLKRRGPAVVTSS